MQTPVVGQVLKQQKSFYKEIDSWKDEPEKEKG
jgi:hypothetical protein